MIQVRVEARDHLFGLECVYFVISQPSADPEDEMVWRFNLFDWSWSQWTGERWRPRWKS